MVKAIVAIEDYRFYQHGALDLKGTLRALVTNQANSGVVQGGSSITQQMVKLTLLEPGQDQGGAQGGHRRHLRPQDHASCATRSRFEQNYSKDWILERYLNIAYFGDGAYGVQAAARHYFDTNAKDLNLRQSRDAGRPGEEPHRLRPDQLPRPRRSSAATSCSTGWPQLNVIPQRQGRQAQEAADLGLHVVSTPATAACTPRAPFFCDYVLNYLLAGPGARQDRRRSARSCSTPAA